MATAPKTPDKKPKKKKAAPRRPFQAALLIGSVAVLLAMVVAVLPREPGARPAASESPAPQPPPPAARPEPAARPAAQPAAPAPRLRPPVARETAARTRPPAPRAAARIAVVMDDAGYSLADLDALLRIPAPLTVAVLPALPHSGEAARRARAAGREVIVHMPMEPLGDENPGPGAILVGQSDAEIRDRLERAFEELPEARGLSNHMGSRAVADRRVMGLVMEALRSRGLFFLDSRTTADTVAREIASEIKVPLLERAEFLDNSPEAAEVEARFAHGVAIALDKGAAVVIGHVQNRATREVLARLLPALATRGVEAVPLSALLD